MASDALQKFSFIQLDKISVKKQIGLISLVVFLGLIVMLISYLSAEYKLSAVQEKSAHASDRYSITRDIKYEYLNARRREKDFLTRRTMEEAEKHAGVVALINTDIDKLDAITENEQQKMLLSEVRSTFDVYANQFTKVVGLLQKRGLTPEEGAEGALRKSVHNVEEKLKQFEEKDLEVLMLMMRRHEKDFIMRGDLKYVKRMVERKKEFEAALAESSIPAAAKQDITEKMNAYHNDFKVLADVELTLVDEVKQLSDLFAVSSPKLDDVAVLIKDNYDALNKQREDLSDFTFQFILSIIVGITILILVLSTIIGNKISSPVIALTNVLKSLSENDLSVQVPGVNRKDEIGSMAKAVEVLKRNTIRMQELDAEQKLEQDRQIERGKQLEKLIVGFEKQVEEMIGTLSSAATELNSTAQSMSEISEDACGKSEAMTLASESTMQNIQVVASAAEELSASISELSMQVQGTSQATSAATSDVNQASQQITGLLKASERIGSVVELILDIAEQTNLLALNATIEAARAGDAGKGFAVVASEVKSLATETSKATEQISQEVQSVQSEVDSAVKAIKSIEVKINEVNQSASAIAAAIEEQNATTEEISRNTQSSASNMAGVNDNVTHVMHAARNTGDSASEVLTASQGVSEQSNKLKDRIAGFLMDVKAI